MHCCWQIYYNVCCWLWAVKLEKGNTGFFASVPKKAARETLDDCHHFSLIKLAVQNCAELSTSRCHRLVLVLLVMVNWRLTQFEWAAAAKASGNNIGPHKTRLSHTHFSPVVGKWCAYGINKCLSAIASRKLGITVHTHTGHVPLCLAEFSPYVPALCLQSIRAAAAAVIISSGQKQKEKERKKKCNEDDEEMEIEWPIN